MNWGDLTPYWPTGVLVALLLIVSIRPIGRRLSDYFMSAGARLAWFLTALRASFVLLALLFICGAALPPFAELFVAQSEIVRTAWTGSENVEGAVFQLAGILVPSLLISLFFWRVDDWFSRPDARQYHGQLPLWFSNAWGQAAVTFSAGLFVATPWLALTVGFAAAWRSMSILTDDLERVDQQLGVDAPSAIEHIQAAAGNAAFAALLTFVACACAVFALVARFRWVAVSTGAYPRGGGPVGVMVLGILICALCFSAVVPIVAPEFAVELANDSGPIAPVLWAMFFLVSVWTVIAWLGRRSGISSSVILVLAIAFAFLVQAVKPYTQLATEQAPPTAQPSGAARSGREELRARFEAWRSGVDWDNEACGATPVFVLAARGGGAYAAGLSAALLARLDTLETGCGAEFGDLLFAVSGVSGGSLGSMLHDEARSCADCPDGAETDAAAPASLSLEQRLAREEERIERVFDVLSDEHLGALIAFIPADLVREFWPWTPLDEGEARSRAWAFEQSFTCGVLRRIHDASDCAYDDGDVRMLARFYEDADGSSTSTELGPLFVLNTSSSGFGFRVAHSRIALNDFSDGTLYSFEEFTEVAPIDLDELHDASWMRAALASARFPAITPAYTLAAAGRADTRYNFVDGGFSDSTGATTALEIYRELEAMAAEDPGLEITPHLIIISDLALAGVNGGDGSNFSDIGAPLQAVMQIRSLLSRLGVRRTLDAFRGGDRDGARPGEDRLGQLHIFELDRANIDLPLTWRLSRVRLDMIPWLLGAPEIAISFERNRTLGALHSTTDVVLNNSCALLRIQYLLQPDDAALPAQCVCAGVDRQLGPCDAWLRRAETGRDPNESATDRHAIDGRADDERAIDERDVAGDAN